MEIEVPSLIKFDCDYSRPPSAVDNIYAKGKELQWNSDIRIDWAQELDTDNPFNYDDRFLPIFGTVRWNRLSISDQTMARRAYQAYTASQFLHGEQAALIAAARLVEIVPDIRVKRFAAQQAADEARHVEVFTRLVNDKIGSAHPLDPGLAAMISTGLSDGRWDFVMLTTQVLLEGLALGTLQQLRDFSRNRLINSIASNIMTDEARHVAFGMKELELYYAELTLPELSERRDFARESLDLLKKRFAPQHAWAALGLDIPAEDARVSEDGQGFSVIIGRLLRRVETMLENLRLTGGSDDSVHRAAKRLKTWSEADVATNERFLSV